MLNNFSYNDASRLIQNVIDERIQYYIRSGAGIEVGWGTVAEITSPYMCSVYLYGNEIPSEGFRLENGIQPNLLDPVRVSMDKRGNRWIDAILNDSTVAHNKLEIDVRDGQLRVGDGTVPPTPFDFSHPPQTTFDGTSVITDELDVDGQATIQGDLTVYGGTTLTGPTDVDDRLFVGDYVEADAYAHKSLPLLYATQSLTDTSTISLTAGADADLATQYRVTYPGNPAMVGKTVVIRVWAEFFATVSAGVGAEVNFSLRSSIPATDGDGIDRITFSRGRLANNGSWQEYSGDTIRTWDADDAVEFRAQFRSGGSATLTPYGAGSAAGYVSRIGYQVVGYV